MIGCNESGDSEDGQTFRVAGQQQRQRLGKGGQTGHVRLCVQEGYGQSHGWGLPESCSHEPIPLPTSLTSSGQLWGLGRWSAT